MTARFTLYGHFESGNVYEPALMLALAGEAFAYRHVDIFAGGQKDPDFLADSRFGNVPALVDGEGVDVEGVDGERRIVQSAAILNYLAEALGLLGPETEGERWQIQEWLFWEQHRLLPGLALYRFQKRWVPGTDAAVLTFLAGRAEAALDRLDQELKVRPFLVGGRPTIADIACAGYCWLLDQAGYPPERWSAIARWLDRLRALPGWRGIYDLLPRADAEVPNTKSR